MKKFLIIVCILCGCWHVARAQDRTYLDTVTIPGYSGSTATDVEEVTEDEEDEETVEQEGFQKPTLRMVSADSLKKIRREKEFEYMRYIDSFYRNTKPTADIPRAEKKEKSTSIFDITGIRVLYWGLALFAVSFLLYKLFFSSNALFTQTKQIRPNVDNEEQIPLTTDHLGELLNTAIKEKNYRTAVRLLYLQTISVLGEKQLLTLSPQKTNYQYVRELDGNPLQQDFSRLTMQYEYTWFGEFPINSSQFDEIQKGHQHFKSQL